jgi:type II secretory pathway component GspD/PulD (secretin)
MTMKTCPQTTKRPPRFPLCPLAPARTSAVFLALLTLASVAYSQAPVDPPPTGTGATTTTTATTPPAPSIGENERGIRFNFRGVPLEMVLNHLSEAAGFIIVLETRVSGTVDAWSNTPLTKNEAVDLLNTVLAKNGFAAIRNGRTLKIVSREEAKTKDIPVRAGAKADEIEKSDEMITQIIPVKYANAPALVQNLTPLLGTYATLSANESGNALVLTGTQTDIRRMVEIVTALDTSISDVSDIKVFPLRFADSKAVADAIKELFQLPTQNNNNQRNQFMNRFGGGPPGFGQNFGPGGNRGNRGGAPASPAVTANSRVMAIADERANAVVVSAPEPVVAQIELLIAELDVSVSDVTELRVFPLKNADPQELTDIMAQLFPDETNANANNRNQGDFRFGGFPGGPGNFGGQRRGGGNNNNSTQSERMKKKGRVVAVPDLRTSSLIVSADAEMMHRLDASAARHQKVYVYSLENGDVQQVEQVLRDMFDRSNLSSRNNNLQNNPLANRSQQNQQNNQNIGGGFGGGQGQNRGGGLQFP